MHGPQSQNRHSLWHVNLGEEVSNAPVTYSIGGRQYVVVAAGPDLYGFTLPQKR